ncbi:hypothetical protein N7457_001460 [Penicillium paradoxum]|uniref:uncharacterized protein n=1 Tax=Penicillium paradoxum TaxID=176176 RepID=UPI0025486A1E|nr:uncharacterized protein N7457_001460 [Penicillium paradoxum]KAJ5794861.1 hypothetical protein N7457_001460 [Penicillium paradoxum]
MTMLFISLVSFMAYLYYWFFIVYSAASGAGSFISSIFDCLFDSGNAVISIFTFDWVRMIGIPWFGRATVVAPVMSNFTAFSFSFLFGVLALQLFGNLV